MTGEETNPEFEVLLEHLKQSRGFDFTGYKRSSLMRRIRKRMQEIAIEDYGTYADYLEVHPDEFTLLFNTILINVTSFFRDQSAWDYLAVEVIPRIVARKELNQPIRIWSAGCASGEESYSLAMALAETIGIEQFRKRVKIYATDADEEALIHARHAAYTARDLTNVPPALLEKYFEQSNGGERYMFHKDLRRSIIFGRHNLVQDAPISRVDLLACRNTLMYFNAEAQAKILARFHFALQDGGFLFLGKAEMLLTHANSFAPVDLKRRIFINVPKTNLRDHLLLMAQTGDEADVNHLTSHVQIRETAFDMSLTAQVVVDLNRFLVLANERARALFNLVPADLGRPLQDLELSYRLVELRSCVEQVYSERRPINLRDIEWSTSSGEVHYLDAQITPILDINGNLLGVNISFTDVTRFKRLQEQVEHSNQELEMAYEELQSTNEELETTNEELQSTVEELETTNEELQSTNEELETMNEELQSTNEELQTMNDEMGQRSSELNRVNAYLESILSSLRGGVLVMDRDLSIQVWNDKAEDLWGLRTDETRGQHFLNLDIGLPVDQLRQPIRACLIGEMADYEVTLEAINRRGRAIQCRVTCTSLVGPREEIQGVIVSMEDLSDLESS